jgi:alanine racemase
MRASIAGVRDGELEVAREASGVVTIDLDQLGANWRALSALVAPAECGAVVKADAYGLGADKVIPALAAAG